MIVTLLYREQHPAWGKVSLTHHKVTSKEPVHALVIWAPGGEEKRVTKDWQSKPPTAK